MKKILFTLCLLLICGNILSSDFCETFEDYEWRIKGKLNLDTASTAISDTIMHQHIREAVIKVLPMIRGIKSIDTILTTANAGAYSLDSTVVGVLNVEWFKEDSLKTMLYSPKSGWYQYVVKGLSGKKGYEKRPSYYDYIDNLLFMFPIPISGGDSIEVSVYRKVNSISALDSLVLIPQKYRVAILEYATFLAASSIQSPLMAIFEKSFKESVATLRSEGANVTTSGK